MLRNQRNAYKSSGAGDQRFTESQERYHHSCSEESQILRHAQLESRRCTNQGPSEGQVHKRDPYAFAEDR
jgi:hypothetical protein